MGRTIAVTTTASQVLRDAAAVASDRKGGDRFDRQAEVMYEFGYAMAPEHGDALGPVVVELSEPPNHTTVEDDEGRTAGIPAWPLTSGVRLIDEVQAWPDGLAFEDGELVDSGAAIDALERDALAVLAAIATYRRTARRATPEEQPCTTS